MSYIPRSLARLIEERNRTLFLPHIQRPFVWSKEQMARLFDSLMRDYPIQTLLFWKTDESIRARQFMLDIKSDVKLSDLYDQDASAEGREKIFVLDGQQRLQTLFTLFAGAIIENGVRKEAWVDVLGGSGEDEEGLMYRVDFSADCPGASWYRIADLRGRHAKSTAVQIVSELQGSLCTQYGWDTKEYYEKHFASIQDLVQRLSGLLREDKHFWVQELDGLTCEYPYSRVLEIFVRVNSGGTKLDAADLMFASMNEGWDDFERRVDNLVDYLNQRGLGFDKFWALKAISVILGFKAEMRPEKFRGEGGGRILKAVKANTDAIERAVQELADLLGNDLVLYSDRVVRSYVSFIPILDYLFRHPNPSPEDRALLVAYFYKAQLFNWFGAGTDGILNQLHGVMEGAGDDVGFPMNEVKAIFERRNRETEVDEHNILQARRRLIVLNIVYTRLFNADPFAMASVRNAPHVDHIYPKSMLYSHMNLDSEDVNHLGNFRFVGASDNLRKRAELPDSYFSRLKAAKVPIRRHLLVEDYANNPSKLKFDEDTYFDFRDRRFVRILELVLAVVNPEVDYEEEE
ncbi:MAG: DUF262 domain-containing protein [Alphaproteobacteria bacterium]|nr:DUF262 domain-containing protein [Alphaproteobacteria bacterium]